MITNQQIKNKLYEEFIKPTNQKKNYIGIEIEIPIVNLYKNPVDFNLVHKSQINSKNIILTFKKMELIMMVMYFHLKIQKLMI